MEEIFNKLKEYTIGEAMMHIMTLPQKLRYILLYTKDLEKITFEHKITYVKDDIVLIEIEEGIRMNINIYDGIYKIKL